MQYGSFEILSAWMKSLVYWIHVIKYVVGIMDEQIDFNVFLL